MGLSFFEKMSGTLMGNNGETHAIDFDIHCEATHLGALLRDGNLFLTGVLRANPWAEDVPIQGYLRLSPFQDGKLEYDVKFTNDDEEEFRLYGEKTLSWRSRFLGMLDLEVELTQDGQHVASGNMEFDLRDLLAFLSSFSPQFTIGRKTLKEDGYQNGMDTRGSIPVPDVLNQREKEILFALARIIIEPSNVIEPASMFTIGRATQSLNYLPSHLQKIFKLGIKQLNSVSWARYRKPFDRINETRRKAIAASLRDLVFALSAPIKIAHFSNPKYLQKVGIGDSLNIVAPEKERWETQILKPVDLENDTTIPCDVVVVGTGAGGAPLAAKLAEKGFAVALVEAGEYYGRARFSGPPEERVMRFSNDGGMNVTLGNTRIVVPTGKLVGGSTAINSGTCFDTPNAVLQEWRAQGFPDDFEGENFIKWLEQTRRELQVEEAKQPYLGEIAHRIAAGAEHMRDQFPRLHHGPLVRNAPGCDGQGLCPMGCPTAAKRSANTTWIPRALKAGATCFTGMTVRRILRRGDRVVAIEAVGQDSYGVVKTLRLKASAVVISAGTLESPLLLQRNGILLPRVGKGLSIHPALGVFGFFENTLGEPWKAIPQGYEVRDLGDEKIKYEGFYVPPGLASSSLDLDASLLSKWMSNVDHVGQFGFMVRDKNKGRVRSGFQGRPLIQYSLQKETQRLFAQGSSLMAELLLQGGAAEVATNIKGVGVVRTLDEARSIATRRIKPSDYRPMGFHPLGTCAMGATKKVGVVDFDHRVFGMQNLYVVDGSSVPTSLGVNPQITIMSMALRAAESLAEKLD